MIRGRNIVVLAIGGLLCSLQVRALVPDSADNPYTGIVDRNVFQIKPPVIPPPTNPNPVIAPSKLTLNGISTILGNKRAYLSAQLPPRPPEPARLETYTLTEGQRDAGIEVLSIDEKNGVVKVDNNGIKETLDFVNNGAKLMASAPVPMGAPGGPVQPGFVRPGMPQNPPPGSGTRSIPQPPRMQANPPTGQSSGIGGGNTGPNQQQFQNNVTPEVQTIMIEAQRMDLQQQGKHEEAALFPITDVTPSSEAPSPLLNPQ